VGREDEERMKVEIWHVVAVLVLVFLAGQINGGISGAVRYIDYGYGGGGYGYGGYGGGGFFGFGEFRWEELYYTYGNFIDAVLFLIIFLGVGKSVLTKHFGEGGNAVYIGVGIFSALALLIYEERTGTYLLLSFGPLVAVLIILLILVGVGLLLRMAGLGGWIAAGVSYVLFYMFVYQPFLTNLFSYSGFSDYLITSKLESMLYGALYVAWLLIIFGIVNKFGKWVGE